MPAPLDPARLRAMRADGRTASEMAREFGVHVSRVYAAMRRHGIPRLPRGPRPGPLNPAWRGGFTHRSDGYVRVLVREPGAAAGRYRYHHRVVAEQTLGRPLLPGEVVDHINGVTSDNRPENLRVFSTNAEHLRATLTGRSQNLSQEQREHRRVLTWLRHRRKLMHGGRARQGGRTGYSAALLVPPAAWLDALARLRPDVAEALRQ